MENKPLPKKRYIKFNEKVVKIEPQDPGTHKARSPEYEKQVIADLDLLTENIFEIVMNSAMYPSLIVGSPSIEDRIKIRNYINNMKNGAFTREAVQYALELAKYYGIKTGNYIESIDLNDLFT